MLKNKISQFDRLAKIIKCGETANFYVRGRWKVRKSGSWEVRKIRRRDNRQSTIGNRR
jgi:hypothetical protein